MSDHERVDGEPPPRRSPFYDHQRVLDAEFREHAGWAAPAWFGENTKRASAFDLPDLPDASTAIGVEHLVTRTAVGCYDLTPHTPIEIRGPSSGAFVQGLFTNDMDLDVGGVRFTLLLDESGGIRGDLVVTRVDEDSFLAIAGPTGGAVVGWIRETPPPDVRVIDRDGAYAALGLWGPHSRDLLQSVTEQDLSSDAFPYFTSREFHVGEVPVLGIRLSAVGELGWELWTPTTYGDRLWETLWQAGRGHGLVALGDRAFSSLSAEQGTRMSGNDLGAEWNPFEAGLGFAVDMDTPFVGKEALRSIRADGVDRWMTCLTLDRRNLPVPRSAEILADREVIGRAIRSDYGYTVDERIAFAYLPTEYANPGSRVEVLIEGEEIGATARAEPLYDPNNERMLV